MATERSTVSSAPAMTPCWTSANDYLGLMIGDRDAVDRYHYFDENGISACSLVAVALSGMWRPAAVEPKSIPRDRVCERCEKAIARRARLVTVAARERLEQAARERLEQAARERLEQAARERLEQVRNAEREIERLSKFILENVPGEPSESEGAVDCAIRIMKKLLSERRRLSDAAMERVNHVRDEEARDRRA